MNQLQQFFATILEKSGAVVDVLDPEGLEVLVPPAMQQALRLPEWARLGFGAELPVNAQRVGLESELMERMGALLGEHGRHTRRIFNPSNPPLNHPERIVEHHLALLNATYRLQEVKPAWSRYSILRFRYTAISDEKRDGVLDFGCNLANGATLDALLPELLAAMDTQQALPALPLGAQCPILWQPRQVLEMLPRALPPRIDHLLGTFFKGMTLARNVISNDCWRTTLICVARR